MAGLQAYIPEIYMGLSSLLVHKLRTMLTMLGMIFGVGAVVAIKERGHLGTDMLVSRLPLAGKKACLVIGHVLMIYVCWLLFQGSLEQTKINWDVEAPVTGASVAIFYASGVFFAVCAALLLARELWRALSGQLGDAEWVGVQESEDLAQVHDLHLDEPAAPKR